MDLVRTRQLRSWLSAGVVLMLGVGIGYSMSWAVAPRPSTIPAYRANGWGPYVIAPPDLLKIDFTGTAFGKTQKVSREYRVGMDGRLNFGEYGSVFVAGLTIDQANEAIEHHGAKWQISPGVVLEVLQTPSKIYYVIERDSNAKYRVQEFPITGNETVLDAIAKSDGLKREDIQDLYLLRGFRYFDNDGKKLPIDWQKLVSGANGANFQILPGDQLVIGRKISEAVEN